MHLHTRRFHFQVGLILFLTAMLAISTNAAHKRASNQQPVSARIEKIVVNGEVVSYPNINQVKVVRASNNEVVPGEVGLSLYANDQVITGAAKIVLYSLDESDNKDRHVTLGENSEIRILKRSVSLTFGRIWVKVAGFFSVKTIYWVLGVPGTEFFFEVTPAMNSGKISTPEKANLSVIEGAVDVSLLDNPAIPKSQDVSIQGTANLMQGKFLRVKSLEEVDLVGGKRLPLTARPLLPEKLKYLKQTLAQIELARSKTATVPDPPKTEQRQTSLSSNWKTAIGAGLRFAVPDYFWTSSGTRPNYLLNGVSPPAFQSGYLTAANLDGYIFATAGYGYVQIPPNNQEDMDALASASVSKNLRILIMPEIGVLILDLENARVGKLETMGTQVRETTAISQASGRKYRVYFAVSFQNAGDGQATMVYIITGCLDDIEDSYQVIARFLSSFKGL